MHMGIYHENCRSSQYITAGIASSNASSDQRTARPGRERPRSFLEGVRARASEGTRTLLWAATLRRTCPRAASKPAQVRTAGAALSAGQWAGTLARGKQA